jgi:hypothetical protein
MDEDHTTTTLPSPLQLSITVTASLYTTTAHCQQSTNLSNGPRIFKKVLRSLKLSVLNYIEKWRLLLLRVLLMNKMTTERLKRQKMAE